jgi:predicted AlkP superfamily phosphohydrolase/phosphomutase
VLIAYGPHIRRGATVDNACLYDIAPTILYLQGQPIPGDMDGKVLDALFTPQHLRDHPVRQA